MTTGRDYRSWLPGVEGQLQYRRLSENVDYTVDLPSLPGQGTERVTFAPAILNRYGARATLTQPVFTGFRQADAEHAAARQAVSQAPHEVEAAESRLARSVSSLDALASRVAIRAPTDGRLLEVHQRSAGVVQAGTPLFTLGNPDSLEISVDVLSSDAVEITEEMPVELMRWRRGSAPMLSGRVRRVSPQGRTEVSALGVEEQRVEVIADPTGSPAAWERLGTGYRVVARFILWAGADVLQVPQSALFPHDDGWAVFVVRDGRAHLQTVKVGHQSGLRAQIVEGLAAGDRVVTHPADELSDGMRVEAR